jgi:glycosyltransferase involved in cell wall biosynthesis
MRIHIVIPAHNEERRIDRTLHLYRRACSHPEFRFLVGLDGSSDGTADVVLRHRQSDQRVVLFDYPKLGKGGVIMETFRRAQAEFVAFVDADAATPPAELLRLIDAARMADGAIATRRHPAAVLPSRRSLARRLTSAGFAFGVRKLFGLPYTDTQCGAKVLRRDVIERCVPFISSRDFLFDVDLLLVARCLGFNIVEIPTIWIDQDGSKLKASSEARKMAASAMRLWLHHRVLPIHGPAPAAAAEPDEERRRVPA